MNISYNWLTELTGTQLNPRELAEVLTRIGLAVEVVHEAGDDFVLEIDLTSNRPDCLSHLGVAREVARSVLPVGAYTEFYWTVNARALMNFVSLRASESAQREIRRYAEAVEAFLAEKMPVTYAAFVAAGRVAP